MQKTGIGLSARAVSDLQRAFDKSRVEFERSQQDAQNDIARMKTQFEVQRSAQGSAR